jgi:hypothetical protein
MSLTRGELESLDREALIERADGAGVARARILTRPELVDELLLRSAADSVTKERARGLFGRARDLLARLVERGLNKPDTADRIRAVGRPLGRPSSPAVLPTLTLAEIYVAQGYRERAMDTLERVLSAEPEHAAARALLTRLRDAAFPVPSPKMAPETDEDVQEMSVEASVPVAPAVAPSAPARAPALAPPAPAPPAEPSYMLDDSPLPPRYDVDECVAIAVDPHAIYVYWEARERTMGNLRALSGSAVVAIRVVAVEPAWDGPRTSVRDYDVRATLGELFVHDLPPGAAIRVAVGLRSEAAFIPIAHSPPLETAQSSAAFGVGATLVRWTPAGTSPVLEAGAGGSDASRVAGAVGRLRKDSALKRARVASAPLAPSAPGTTPSALAALGALGASEVLAGGGSPHA